MTRKEALAELITKVEAGTPYETMGHTMMCQRAFPKPDDFDGSRESYSNSAAQMAILAWRNDDLNAAKALHEAVLPGWLWTNGAVPKTPYGQGKSRLCFVWPDDPTSHLCKFRPEGKHPNPARAWLLAILKALHSMEMDND